MDSGNGVVLEDKYSSQKWQVTLAGFPTSSLFFFFPLMLFTLLFPCGGALDKHMDGEMGNKRGGYENKVTPDTSCTLHYPPIFFLILSLPMVDPRGKL